LQSPQLFCWSNAQLCGHSPCLLCGNHAALGAPHITAAPQQHHSSEQQHKPTISISAKPLSIKQQQQQQQQRKPDGACKSSEK